MLRLRTSSGLSLLALAVGIAGTAWLSTLTAGWHGPAPRVATLSARSASRHAWPLPHRRHGAISVVPARRSAPDRPGRGESLAAAPPPAALLPLAMPSDTSQRWDELRGHLDGRVVLHVDIDDRGRVAAAGISESSGDPVLDEHALRSVRGWRFAVPADHPEGISGELPMRFSSRGDGIARVP
ncbi:energy transducer TonB [Rhodanobacter ginsengisoli]|uniref:Energy transducer TonB n=1 Tax=Rhodanobacter ginsengisoli TaxID=418646 RepID=A0ABW0QRU9_9GAMM